MSDIDTIEPTSPDGSPKSPSSPALSKPEVEEELKEEKIIMPSMDLKIEVKPTQPEVETPPQSPKAKKVEPPTKTAKTPVKGPPTPIEELEEDAEMKAKLKHWEAQHSYKAMMDTLTLDKDMRAVKDMMMEFVDQIITR